MNRRTRRFAGHKIKWRGILLASALANAPVLRAAADACSAGYITDQIKGEETIDQYGSNYQAVNVFSYEFNGECRIVAKSPWVQDAAGRLKSDPNRLIMVDIVNEIQPGPGPCQSMTPGQMIHYFVSDPGRRASHIREVVSLSAMAQGVEIDYENIIPETKPYLTQFMQELRAALPSNKKLGIVVQPKTAAGGGAGRNLDWRGIEPYVDFFRVMAYYYSWKTSPPGPVITYAKLKELADYVMNDPAQGLSREKARIVLSLYGWDWKISPPGEGKLVRYEEAMAIAQSRGITPQRDPVEDTLHFQYSDSSGTLHEVWIEDFVGQSKRIQILLDRNFPAIDLWHLNTGDPALWPWFTQRVRANCPNLAAPLSPPAAATVSSLSPVAVATGASNTTFTISGAGFEPSDVVLWDGNPYIPAFVSQNSLQVAVKASDFKKAYVGRVSIAQNGKLSNATSFYVVGNPLITSFDPAFAVAGGGPFTLTVRGGGFEPASQATWNGQSAPTQFMGPEELRVSVSSPSVVPASIRVGVLNPTSGGLISRFFPVIAGQPDGTEPGTIDLGPNPWRAGKNIGGIKFFGLPQGGEVQIFSMSGQLVRRMEHSGGGMAEWDLKNTDNIPVATGVYMYWATLEGGGRKNGLLTVVR